MNKQQIQYLIWTILVTFIFLSIPSAVRLLPTMVGQDFKDTHEFKNEKQAFYEYLKGTVLNPIDWDEVEQKMTVSVAEIDEHRYRYGSLSDQVQSIMDQYVDQLDEAEENGNDKVVEAIVKERDEKIQDIEKNFEDTEHVREKVLQEKLNATKKYVGEQHHLSSSTKNVYSYYLKDVDSGEVFKHGQVNDATFFDQDIFDEEEGYLKTSFLDALSNMTDGYYDGDAVYVDPFEVELKELAGKDKQFEGVIAISENAFNNSYLKEQQQYFYWKKIRNYTFWLLALISLIVVCTKLKFNKNWWKDVPMIEKYQTVKIDYQIIIFLVGMLFMYGTKDMIENRLYYSDGWMPLIDAFIPFILFFILVGLLITQVLLLVERWKRPGQFMMDVKQSSITQFLRSCQELLLNRSIGFQAFVLLIGFFLAGLGFAIAFSFIFVGFGSEVLLIFYMFMVFFFGLPALYIFVTRTAYLNRVFKATEQMAAGTLHEPVKVKGKSPIAKHAKHLNALREGVRSSMTAQAKSERLKTELITNVSHDLRTPLTSIITYTDLLKTKDLSEEERLKYVDIVDQKAERLKTLIEDLFEVSKMASGNMTLTKQKVDLTQLLQQSLAEHEDRIAKSSLDFRVNLPETPIYAYVDGQKWWRVLDNLIVNTLKYSLAHTRVYIQLVEEEGRAIFTIKNISEYALNENSEELFERFKRGDESRHTEGSGLGLAIAQSIVDMHQGEMDIEIDGDLFKVTVGISTQ
ncbi:MAG TPA: histidine kinase dimerization/phospho-acceptor domain-containing protein [Sporosarcina sp.]|nr:histidine kinase dimerization/phospho-acceptor domain-containing protein [Sporosarcina sp.]